MVSSPWPFRTAPVLFSAARLSPLKMDRNTVSTRNAVASHVRNVARLGRPRVDVIPQDRVGTLGSSYTTGDHIQGEAVVTTAHDARFDGLEICLEGIT